MQPWALQLMENFMFSTPNVPKSQSSWQVHTVINIIHALAAVAAYPPMSANV